MVPGLFQGALLGRVVWLPAPLPLPAGSADEMVCSGDCCAWGPHVTAPPPLPPLHCVQAAQKRQQGLPLMGAKGGHMALKNPLPPPAGSIGDTNEACR